MDRAGFFHFFGTMALDEEGVGRLNNGPWLRPRQVHGDTVVIADRGMDTGSIPPTGDGLTTNNPGILLAVSTADCLPIVLIDPVSSAASVIHAGWRGTVLNIAKRAVLTMQGAYGSVPSNLVIGIGPGIGRCCFEVGGDVWQTIEKQYAYADAVISDREGEKAKVDLKALNRLQLIEAGVSSNQIADLNLCTACNPSLFHSYRRDKMKRGNLISGVMLYSCA